MIITDLDNTLFNTAPRARLVPADTTDKESAWRPWHAGCGMDIAIGETIRIHNTHESGPLVILTRRPEEFRRDTIAKLANLVYWDEIVMAPDNDPRHPLQYKAEELPKILVRYGYEGGRRFTFMDANAEICQHVRDNYPQALVLQVTSR